MNEQTQKWVIFVGGYGSFLHEGSEQEAEEMRAHKARWERGVGLKRLADQAEIAAGRPSDCLNHPNYYAPVGARKKGMRYACDCSQCSEAS